MSSKRVPWGTVVAAITWPLVAAFIVANMAASEERHLLSVFSLWAALLMSGFNWFALSQSLSDDK